MLKITRDTVVYAMSPDNAPVARVKDGDTLIFETMDCFSGQLAKESDQLGPLDWGRINPATGPVYIEGAAPGDTLKVEILRIDLAPQAATVESPDSGITGLAAKEEHTKILPVSEGKVVFNDCITLPEQAMIGVIGTAPAAGAISTGTPDLHGGNMDCKCIGAGTTLYLPVNVEGALLAMGDLHALMGDGEVEVCGVEIAGAVTVRVTALKQCALPTPFLVNDDTFMSIFSALTVDEACVGATMSMHGFLMKELGLNEHEAGMLLSVVGNLRICQIVDPEKTCRMELPKSIAETYGYEFA